MRSERCVANGWRVDAVSIDGFIGFAMITQGQLGAGLKRLEGAARRARAEGYEVIANWLNWFIFQIYVDRAQYRRRSSEEVQTTVSVRSLPSNILAVIKIFLTGEKRVIELAEELRRSRQFDPNGYTIGLLEGRLGLLYKAKKKPDLAVQHLTEARRILAPFGPSFLLPQIDAALAELSPAACA